MHSPAKRVLVATLLALPLACSEAEPVNDSPATPSEARTARARRDHAPTPWPTGEKEAEQPRVPRVYYSFIDASGSVRMVDSLEAVPPALRQKAKRIEVQPPRTPAPGAESPAPAAAAPPSPFARAAASNDARNAQGEIVIYTAKWCGWCRKALAHLDERNVSYRNRDIDDDPGAKDELRRLTGSTSVPAFEIDGEVVRGYDMALLDSLLDRRR
jgi:glutaredoxin